MPFLRDSEMKLCFSYFFLNWCIVVYHNTMKMLLYRKLSRSGKSFGNAFCQCITKKKLISHVSELFTAKFSSHIYYLKYFFIYIFIKLNEFMFQFLFLKLMYCCDSEHNENISLEQFTIWQCVLSMQNEGKY